MPPRHTEASSYETESIDVAAYLVTLGHEMIVVPQHGTRRATFRFPANNELYRSIADFTSGHEAPARHLLNVRSWLYRRASEIGKGGVI